MKVQAIFFGALLVSLIFLSPIMSRSTEVTVIPDTLSQTIIDIHSPRIKITADIDTEMTISLYRLILEDNSTIEILNKSPFNVTRTIPLDEPGLYILEILSPELGVVVIEEVGVYPVYQIIALVLFIINLVLFIIYIRDYLV